MIIFRSAEARRRPGSPFPIYDSLNICRQLPLRSRRLTFGTCGLNSTALCMASTAFISAVLSPRLDAASGENLRQKAGLRLGSGRQHESGVSSEVCVAECQPHGAVTAMLGGKKKMYHLKYIMHLWYFELRILLESPNASNFSPTFSRILHFCTCAAPCRSKPDVSAR